MNINVIPWVLACVTAVWFGFLAFRAGKGPVLWTFAGGVFGLVSSTFVFGLGHATGIPYSDKARSALHLEWTLIAIAVILLVGGLITWTLWRRSRAGATQNPGPGSPVNK